MRSAQRNTGGALTSYKCFLHNKINELRFRHTSTRLHTLVLYLVGLFEGYFCQKYIADTAYDGLSAVYGRLSHLQSGDVHANAHTTRF